LPSKFGHLTTTLLRWGAFTAALWLGAEYLRFAWFRLPEPYALRWLETYLYRSAWQAFSGYALYPEANAEYIAPIYNPLYFLLGGWAFRVFGASLSVLRVLSLSGFALCGLALYRFHRRAGLERLLCVSLAATLLSIPRALNYWMTTANLDAPMLALLLWALVLMRAENLSRRRAGAAGALFALSFLVKQQALPLVLAALAFAALVDRRAALSSTLAFLLVAGGSALVLELGSGGVYSATTVGLPLRSTTNSAFSPFDWCVRTMPVATIALSIGFTLLMLWAQRRERILWALLLAATLALSYLSGHKSGGTINNLLPYLVLCFWALGEGYAALRVRFAQRTWPGLLLCVALIALLGTEASRTHAHNGRLARAHESAPGESAYRAFEEFELRLAAIVSRYDDPIFVGGRFGVLVAAGRPIQNFHQTALYEGTIRTDRYDVERILEAPLRERRYTAMLVWRRPEEERLRALIERYYVKRAELGRDPLIGLDVDLYEPKTGGD
jgi:hypothetical protein